jgi:Flp pilus assembly protein TadD
VGTAPRPRDAKAPAAELIQRVRPGGILLEDFRPLPLNLEWRLSELHWIAEGVSPFIRSEVPYLVNNDGRASADAAALLLANCLESPPDSLLRVLEIGAGSALFARYLLDEFRLLCERGGHDFYERLEFHVTDRSARSVSHWRDCGVFGEHAGRVVPTVLDARWPDPTPPGPFRAVFANYVLDSLPAAVLRRHDSGWQRLCARASVREENLAAHLPGWTIDRVRDRATSADSADLTDLLPLLQVIDSELAFLPFEGSVPPDWAPGLDGAIEGVPLVYNFGALECLFRLVRGLDASGFVLIRDYGQSADTAPPAGGAQRWGSTTTVPLDFARVERALRSKGAVVARPTCDSLIDTRIVMRTARPQTVTALETRFDRPIADDLALIARARAHADNGLFQEALDAYRQAAAANPRDWQVLGEIARLACRAGDHAAGLDLAQAALALNPWYSPSLWSILGDSYRGVGRLDDSHAAYAEACRLDSRAAEAHLKLARSWLERGDLGQTLEAVARGLAADADDAHRHELLDTQHAALDLLARIRAGRREATYRRQLRDEALARQTGEPSSTN